MVAAQSVNDEAIKAWNTVLYDKFVRFRKAIVGGLSSHGRAMLERHPPGARDRVLDVGCGFGDTTIDLARLVGAKGEATGVDAAERFIEQARAEAKAAGVSNARFAVCDAQGGDLGGPYHRAYSRFGTMFFSSPVAALRNVKKSLAPRAPLHMVVWRKKEENPFMAEAEQRVLAIIPYPEKGDQVTCGPGPFSMASADLVSTQLLAAGFERPVFERIDTDVWIGGTVAEAIDFALALGPAGEVVRLAGDVAEKNMVEIRRSLEDLMAGFVRPDGVWARSSSWLVSARVPG
jgi:ubiquinone/menaquinone biosynthesis C-methylase UbiE